MKKRRASKKLSPQMAVVVLVLCLLAVFVSRYLENQAEPVSAPAVSGDTSFEVRFLDIGQGDSALVRCGGETMLIDGGKVKNNQKLIARLKELGITHLDAVICSHPDEDHCGGLAAVLSTTTTDSFFCSVDSWHTKAFSDIVKYAEEQNLSITVPTAGDTFALGEASVEFLGPVEDYGDDPNEGSLVARVRYGQTSFLFTGDMGFEAEDDMLAANVDVSATVLKVAHHGSAGSSSVEFLEAVNPEYAVISVGADNDYGHPTEAALSRLFECGIAVYRTDLLGEIVAVSDGTTVTISSEEKSAVQKETSQTTDTYSYVGNASSKVVHTAACGKLPGEDNRVYFETLDDALAAGYRKHASCLGS